MVHFASSFYLFEVFTAKTSTGPGAYILDWVMAEGLKRFSNKIPGGITAKIALLPAGFVCPLVPVLIGPNRGLVRISFSHGISSFHVLFSC